MSRIKIISLATLTLLSSNALLADASVQLSNLQTQISQLQNELHNSSNNTIVAINPALSWQMMSNMPGVGKELTLLHARQSGLNSPLTLGGYMEADLIYQHTNTTGINNAFEPNGTPLSNGATFGTSTGNSATNLFLSNTDLATTANINSWLTGYIQLGDKNVASSGSSFQIQDAYLVAGNLAKSPVYAFIGQKDIDFGSFASVNMYYAPLTRQFFEAIGNTLGMGLNSHGFNGTVSLMNGGGGATNMYTTNNNNINNYAFNASYGLTAAAINWNIGAGYLHGSRFLNTSNTTNGAWDLNGKISTQNFDLLAEYVATTSKSYGTIESLPPLNPTTAQVVNIWDIGTDYRFHLIHLNSVVNLDYSQANLANGSANLLKQLVVGYRIEPFNNNIWTGIEYAYNKNGVNAANGTLYGANYHSSTLLLDLSAAF